MATLAYAVASKFRAELDRAAQSGDQIMLLPGKGLCIGESPFQPRAVFDFSEERFVGIGEAAKIAPTSISQRRTGQFEVLLEGKMLSSNSLKALLMDFLTEIESAHPGTWEALTKVKARTRRIISRSKEDLFDSPHLVDDFAVPIGSGWYTNTNNSKQQVARWLEEATKAAGLVWGRDVTARL